MNWVPACCSIELLNVLIVWNKNLHIGDRVAKCGYLKLLSILQLRKYVIDLRSLELRQGGVFVFKGFG